MAASALGVLQLGAGAAGSGGSESSSPRRGDVVAFRILGWESCPRKVAWSIGKVVGLPGETVGVKDGRLVVDGRVNDLPPFLAPQRTAADLSAQRIPTGEYLLLGDPRDPGCDSRAFGPVPGYALRSRSLPAVGRTPYARGLLVCETFGRPSLEALFGLSGSVAVARAVAGAAPSASARAIRTGCIAGLPGHRVSHMRKPSVPPDDDLG